VSVKPPVYGALLAAACSAAPPPAVEVTDPDTTTCALSTLPGEQGAAYRLRAALTGGPADDRQGHSGVRTVRRNSPV
jgi:hypothetical protein